MVKLLVFAILLASSPASGLLEELLEAEKRCYSGCDMNYATSDSHSKACKQGCDYKLHNEDCTSQCKSMSIDEEMQASCQVGCTLSHPTNHIQDTAAVDPIPGNQVSALPAESEPHHPHSIILIRLRQRPSVELPSMNQFFGSDPIKMFNDLIRQFHEQAKTFEETIQKSLGDNANGLPKLPNLDKLSELPKSIPIIHIPLNGFDVSSDEQNHHQRIMDDVQRGFGHPNGHFRHGHFSEIEPSNNRFRQFFNDVHTEWNDLVRKQPKIPIWIFLAIFLSSSAILWYMVVSLCRQAPTRDALSIRAQELVFHPYDYEGYEKEKVQPDDEPYNVTESLPIKIKLTNI